MLSRLQLPSSRLLLQHSRNLLKYVIRRRRRRLLLAALSVLLLLTSLAASSSAAKYLRSSSSHASWSSASFPPSLNPAVTAWDPDRPPLRRCRGTFASPPSAHSPDGFPEVAVRDIAPDARPASTRDFRELRRRRGDHARAGLRVVLYVTAHLGVRLLSAEEGRAVGLRPDVPGAESAFEAAVDHVLPVNDFVLKPGRYAPGKMTRYGDEVSEWQVIVSVFPSAEAQGSEGSGPGSGSGSAASEESFVEAVRRAWSTAGDDELAFVPIAFRRFDSPWEHTVFNATFSAACVLGWQDSAPFPLLKTRPQSCEKASGAVALGGSPLHGAKARDPVKVREVAHYCARSLLGPVRFDLVALPVIPRASLSEIAGLCGRNSSCIDAEMEGNEKFLRTILSLVEEEMFILDVPPALFSRVLLVPICRLGTNFAGGEKGWPCKSSFWSGQYISSYLMYNLVGPSFRWSSSFDLDEFLSPTPTFDLFGDRKLLRVTRAEALFDSLNMFMFRRGKNSLKFIWLNFRLRHGHHARPLTRALLKSHPPALRNPNSREVRQCYARQKGQGNNGKAALKCDNGVGFTIHAAVQVLPGKILLNETSRPGNVATSSVRLWHPRLEGSLGECDFEPERF